MFLWLTCGSCGVAGPPCPYKISALGHAPSQRLRPRPPLQWVPAAAEELGLCRPAATAMAAGHSFALADYRVHGSTREHENTFLFYTHVIFKSVYNFFPINSDSYHLLTLGPSPTAQIRIMVLGAETYTFSSCYYFWYFSSRHARTNFLKELLQFPIVARKFVATHSVWKHGLFMPLTRYQKHPFHQPKVGGKLPT